MPEIFFTADTHWGHTNIIKHCGRPFSNTHEMDTTMIERWNSVVSPGDTVYHLGDFGLGSLGYLTSVFQRLNGTIHIVRGNHDKAAALRKIGFQSISEILEIKVPNQGALLGEQRITLCHYAMRTWNKSHWGSWQLHGHSHGTLKEDPLSLSMDVGVDCHDFTPLSYSQVKKYLQSKKVGVSFLSNERI